MLLLVAELTVFITTFNRAAALADTLDHLTTLLESQDVEIIVFDDGSSDGTSAVCARFADRARIIRSSENIGLIRARNRGVREASTDLVLFLDDDSYILDASAVARIRSAFRADSRIAVLAANIATRARPAGLDDPLAPSYVTAAYIGGGHVLRRSAMPQPDPYSAFLNRYGGEETTLSLTVLGMGGVVVFDPGLRVYHAEDPSRRPSALRMASLFTNEISTMVALFPMCLWVPLALKKLLSHWRTNWKTDAGEVLAALRRILPAAVRQAFRSRRPLHIGTIREFWRRRAAMEARSAGWQLAYVDGRAAAWPARTVMCGPMAAGCSSENPAAPLSPPKNP